MSASPTPISPNGAQVILGLGSVIRNGPLTVVIGGGSAVGRATLAVTDALAEGRSWGFDEVASSLQQLVVEFQPSGVAAVLDSDGIESFAFVFDQAEVRSGETAFKGRGRDGWTVELIPSSPVELRLASVPYSSASGEIELRSGLLPGAGAIIEVSGIVSANVVADTLPAEVPPLPVDAPPLPPVDEVAAVEPTAEDTTDEEATSDETAPDETAPDEPVAADEPVEADDEAQEPPPLPPPTAATPDHFPEPESPPMPEPVSAAGLPPMPPPPPPIGDLPPMPPPPAPAPTPAPPAGLPPMPPPPSAAPPAPTPAPPAPTAAPFGAPPMPPPPGAGTPPPPPGPGALPPMPPPPGSGALPPPSSDPSNGFDDALSDVGQEHAETEQAPASPPPSPPPAAPPMPPPDSWAPPPPPS